MSLQYIIDGYNIINHPLFIQHAAKKIRDLRIALLEFIRINKLCGSPKNKITVVFDGHSDSSIRKIGETDINIMFSRKETADECIKKMVEVSSNPKNIVVVSDDKEIKLFVKSLGGQTRSVEEFINRKANLQSREKNLLKPELTYSQIHQINQELRKIWLR